MTKKASLFGRAGGTGEHWGSGGGRATMPVKCLLPHTKVPPPARQQQRTSTDTQSLAVTIMDTIMDSMANVHIAEGALHCCFQAYSGQEDQKLGATLQSCTEASIRIAYI